MPALASGLTDHIGSFGELLSTQVTPPLGWNRNDRGSHQSRQYHNPLSPKAASRLFGLSSLTQQHFPLDHQVGGLYPAPDLSSIAPLAWQREDTLSSAHSNNEREKMDHGCCTPLCRERHGKKTQFNHPEQARQDDVKPDAFPFHPPPFRQRLIIGDGLADATPLANGADRSQA